jgi:hypothetical protein
MNGQGRSVRPREGNTLSTLQITLLFRRVEHSDLSTWRVTASHCAIFDTAALPPTAGFKKLRCGPTTECYNILCCD